MKIEDFAKQNPNKSRSVEDLVRFLKTRVELAPNYCVLLGAGCSVSSGIPSGGELIEGWKRELYSEFNGDLEGYSSEVATDYFSKNHSSWFNSSNEYSSLFEKKYDLPSQRRMFIEQLVADKIPSIGYAYLVNLVKNSYINTIFTTNFDDLVNEAFYHYSDKRPMLCAHDSSVSSLNKTSSRPKIVKLHGDYLFDDIKSSLRETESLEENIKDKFVELLKGQGLIVAGYSGSDRSIMDVVNHILRFDDFLSHGLYWCFRKGDYISEDLRKLLWKERVYYVVIDGFDELFAKLNSDLCEPLSLEDGLVKNKTSKIIESYTSNSALLKSSSDIIRNDIERLEKQKTKNNISKLIQEMNEKNKATNLEDHEFSMLIQIESLIGDDKYHDAVKLGEEELNKSPSPDLYALLLKSVARAYRASNQDESARGCYKELISYDKNDTFPYSAMASMEFNFTEKAAILKKAIDIDGYDFSNYDLLAGALIESLEKGDVDDKELKLEEAQRALDRSLELNPSNTNRSWAKKFSLISKKSVSEEEKDAEKTRLLNDLKKQGPYTKNYIALNSKHLGDKGCKDSVQEFFEDILSHKECVENYRFTGYLSLAVYSADVMGAECEFGAIVDELCEKKDLYKNPSAIFRCASVVAKRLGDFERAVSMLGKIHYSDLDYQSLSLLLDCYIALQDESKSKEVIEKVDKEFTAVASLESKIKYYDEFGFYAKALEAVKSLQSLHGGSGFNVATEAYYLIKLDRNSEAREVLQGFLRKVNFDKSYTAEIVNYELACKNMGRKVDKARLEAQLGGSRNYFVKAAVYSVMGKLEESVEMVKQGLLENKLDISSLRSWPALSSVKDKGVERDLKLVV
ncbi:SIR2 family protein [Halomonas koreensis]|uniref:SIR2 family protein n=1 Tax=Halomonas koreensis TaxID=245385 RepID=A0ABU1G1B8_9GAMM|nr:SIR2 family protein [Halomonas koreensis]MDR5866732.1 SIR2 family protein [Halomonas koreensis]